jgi:hypothetical protein
MRLVLESVHGNSKVASLNEGYIWGKQITISPRNYKEGREHFTELFNFFTTTLGGSFDIQTTETIYPHPRAKWTYQIEPKYGNHKFFVKDKKDLDWFLLKYSHFLTNRF